jgi:hypothetical protein
MPSAGLTECLLFSVRLKTKAVCIVVCSKRRVYVLRDDGKESKYTQ